MIYMYVEFHPYTLLFHIVEKLILMILIHVFQVLFLTKSSFEFNVKKHRYIIYHVYWILSKHVMLQRCFNILFLYLNKFLRN